MFSRFAGSRWVLPRMRQGGLGWLEEAACSSERSERAGNAATTPQPRVRDISNSLRL
jgi:hypothetical protein